MTRRLARIGALALAMTAPAALAVEPIRPARERFAAEGAVEVPGFQRHVLTLMGRLGCNTRSCHGSFQGQGGLRLSLFGYDFKADRETLLKAGSGRVDVDDPEGSKILQKSTLAIPHKGGKRMDPEAWQYRLLARWIEGGARGVQEKAPRFDRLEVTPAEVHFGQPGQKTPLRVVAHWADGQSEDVTCLARFRTNDESVAEVSEDGVISSVGPGDTHVVAFYDNGVAPVPVLRAVSELAGQGYPAVPTPTKVDELVVAKLRKMGIVPSPTCTDAEFLRRVGLDLAGTLPTPDEVEAFLSDPAPGKRARKVDELLARPSYAAWWTTKLCDYTGDAPKTLNAQQVGPQAPRQWYDWIYKRVAENQPYDQLVAGLVLATSRPKGESYDDFVKLMASYSKPGAAPSQFADRQTMPYFWSRQNFRKPEERVIGFSYAFLGVRLECAQCHKHPFDQWTQDDFNRFGAFFNAVGFGVAADARESFQRINKETGLDKLMGGERNRKLQQLRQAGEVSPWQEVYISRNGLPARVAGVKPGQAARPGRVVSAKVLGGEEVALNGTDDPRGPLMDWLRSKDNPYFARAFVNRAWASYFGVGIVNPPDDMNQANPPTNRALLDYLADGFVDHDFDMKWLHREITSSLAYQRGWQVNPTNRLDQRNFSRALVRRIPAEVLIDAVTLATGSGKVLLKASTEVNARAIGPRFAAPGNRFLGNYASRVFGGSTRETNCDCNRSNEPNLLQAIYLQNDAELYAAIDRADGWLVEKTGATPGPAFNGGGGGGNGGMGPALLALSVPELEARLKQARDAKRPFLIERIEARIAQLKQDPAAGEPPADGDRPAAPAPRGPRVAPIAAGDREAIVRQAYLRTLSRHPNDTEARAAADYLAGSDDGARGLRDLLWALLNTKEFITNH